MIIPDEYQRTIRMPVRFKGGKWLLALGTALPEIEDDTLAELIVPAFALLQMEDRVRWTREQRRELFPAGTSIWARVRGKGGVTIRAAGCVEQKIWPGGSVSVVEVRLIQQLDVVLRAGKTGILSECPCAMPALNAEAASVNEAYMLISQKYETHRRSHSGSVFKKVFYQDGGYLRPLEGRRMQVEQEVLHESIARE